MGAMMADATDAIPGTTAPTIITGGSTASVVSGGSVKADTEYLIFVRYTAKEGSGLDAVAELLWRSGDKVNARSAEAAEKKYAEDNPPKTGESLTIVAVAVKWWSPVTFRARTVTTVEAVA